MMKIIRFAVLTLILLTSPVLVFAGGWTIADISNKKKLIKYDGSKVAELVYSGGWQILCIKGREMGNSSRKYDTLKRAMRFTTSVCKKY